MPLGKKMWEQFICKCSLRGLSDWECLHDIRVKNKPFTLNVMKKIKMCNERECHHCYWHTRHVNAFALCRKETASWQCGRNVATNQMSLPLVCYVSVILTLHSIKQPCPLCMSTLFLSDISPIVTPSVKVRPLPFPECSCSIESLSSVLTSLSCCGSRSQCKGLLSLDPRVCVSAQFLLHGNTPSPMLCLFIAQLSLLSQCCILGKREKNGQGEGVSGRMMDKGKAGGGDHLILQVLSHLEINSCIWMFRFCLFFYYLIRRLCIT